MYEISEETKKKYKEEIAILKEELAEYENDFATLSNAGDLLAKMYAACDCTTSAVSSVGSTLNDITELGTSDKVPGFENLFSNFNTKIIDDITEVNVVNNNCISELEEVGRGIDDAKRTVGQEIDQIVKQIEAYETIIESL